MAALRLFAEIDDWALLEARLERDPAMSPDERGRLTRDFEWERHQSDRPATLAEYCAAR